MAFLSRRELLLGAGGGLLLGAAGCSGGDGTTIPPYSTVLHSLTFTPDGSTALVAGWYYEPDEFKDDDNDGQDDKEDRPLSGLVSYLPLTDGGGRRFLTAGKEMFSVAVSPDGRMAAWGGFEARVYVADLFTGDGLWESARNGDQTNCVAFSPDSRRLVSAHYGERKFRVWDAANGRLLFVISLGAETAIYTAFSPDGTQIAGAIGNRAALFDAATGTPIRAFTGHTAALRSLAFSPDGTHLVTGAEDGTVRLWNTTTGAEILNLRRHNDAVYSVAFSPDGRTFASGGKDGLVLVYNVTNGQQVSSAELRFRPVYAVAYHPDGRLGFSGVADRPRLLDFTNNNVLTI